MRKIAKSLHEGESGGGGSSGGSASATERILSQIAEAERNAGSGGEGGNPGKGESSSVGKLLEQLREAAH